MAVSGKLADGVIKITLAGYDAAKTQLTALQSQLKQVSAGVQSIGSASSKGFAVATGSITGLLKAADPVRFEILGQKIQILAMYLGQALIPILDRAIKFIDRLIEVVKGLTNEQKDQILYWTEITVVVLAAGTALAVLGLVITQVATAVRGLGIAMRLLTTGPIGKLLLVVAAVAAALTQVDDVSGKAGPVIEMLGGAFAKVADVVGKVLTPVLDALDIIFQAFEPLLKTVLDLIVQLIPPILSVAVAFGGVLGVLAELVGSVLNVMVSLLSVILTTFAEMIAVVADVANELLKAFGPTLISAVELVADVMKGVLEVIKGIVQAAKDLVDILDDLNPFSSSSSSGGGGGGGTSSDTGAGDYRHSSGSGGNFGGDDAKKTNQIAPLARPVKVEQFGLEDAFKRAQQGASFDPAKLAENERKKLAQEQLATQKQIEENTRRQNAAQLAF